MSGERECPTSGCHGDARYAAPGRHHREGCTYPTPVPSEVAETTAGERQVSADDRYRVEAILRKAARDHLGIAEGFVWDSGISSDQADALLTSDWLAAHDDRVRREEGAKVLREAADDARAALINEIGSGHTTTYSVRRWLNDRAASVARGEGL